MDISKALPKTTAQQQYLGLRIYDRLTGGQPVAVDQLTNESELIESLPHLYRNEDGDIIAYFGLNLSPMGYRIEIGNQTLYGWSAWDSLVVAQLLCRLRRTSIQIHSRCPVTDKVVTLQLSESGDLLKVSSIRMALSTKAIPTERHLYMPNFCHNVLFFDSLNDAQSWCTHHPGTEAVSLQEALSMCHQRNDYFFGDVDWSKMVVPAGIETA